MSTRADLETRVRTSMAEMRENAIAKGLRLDEMPEHGEAGGVKWLVSDPGVEPAVFEGGYGCWCGDLFVRTEQEGGIKAAQAALLVEYKLYGRLVNHARRGWVAGWRLDMEQTPNGALYATVPGADALVMPCPEMADGTWMVLRQTDRAGGPGWKHPS